MDELVAWLRCVFDEQKRVADLPLVTGANAPADLRRSREEGRKRTLARLEAERELLATALSYHDPLGDPAASGLAEHIAEHLAWGHRFDRPGWREDWAPAGFESPFEQAGKGNGSPAQGV